MRPGSSTPGRSGRWSAPRMPSSGRLCGSSSRTRTRSQRRWRTRRARRHVCFRAMTDAPTSTPSSGSEAVLAVQAPADFAQPLARLRSLLLGGGAIALGLAVVLANILAANVVGPLEGLSRAALRIQRGRLDQKVELERVDEIGRLEGHGADARGHH